MTLEWKDNSGAVLSTELDLYDLPVGNYFLWATDGNGCVNLLEQYNISDAGDVLINDVYPLPSYCGNNNGSITIEAVSGLSDMLEYSIDNGSTWLANEGVFTDLVPGPYSVRVRVPDGSNCQDVYEIDPLIIEDLAGPTVSATSTPATGSNADGTITIIADGFGNLAYILENGIPQDNGSFYDLAAGMYHYKVEDENGCFTIDSIYVGTVAGIVLTAIAGNDEACMGNSLRVPVMVKNFTQVNAFSATLNYNPLEVECIGLYPGSENSQLPGLSVQAYPALQRIVASWNDQNPVTISDTALLFELVFIAGNPGVSFLTWDESSSRSEGYFIPLCSGGRKE